jgi:hypothetical protein
MNRLKDGPITRKYHEKVDVRKEFSVLTVKGLLVSQLK